MSGIRGVLGGRVLGALGCATIHEEGRVPPAEPRVDPGFARHNDAHDDAKLVRLSEHVYAAIGFDIGNSKSNDGITAGHALLPWPTGGR